MMIKIHGGKYTWLWVFQEVNRAARPNRKNVLSRAYLGFETNTGLPLTVDTSSSQLNFKNSYKIAYKDWAKRLKETHHAIIYYILKYIFQEFYALDEIHNYWWWRKKTCNSKIGIFQNFNLRNTLKKCGGSAFLEEISQWLFWWSKDEPHKVLWNNDGCFL